MGRINHRNRILLRHRPKLTRISNRLLPHPEHITTPNQPIQSRMIRRRLRNRNKHHHRLLLRIPLPPNRIEHSILNKRHQRDNPIPKPFPSRSSHPNIISHNHRTQPGNPQLQITNRPRKQHNRNTRSNKPLHCPHQKPRHLNTPHRLQQHQIQPVLKQPLSILNRTKPKMRSHRPKQNHRTPMPHPQIRIIRALPPIQHIPHRSNLTQHRIRINPNRLNRISHPPQRSPQPPRKPKPLPRSHRLTNRNPHPKRTPPPQTLIPPLRNRSPTLRNRNPLSNPTHQLPPPTTRTHLNKPKHTIQRPLRSHRSAETPTTSSTKPPKTTPTSPDKPSTATTRSSPSMMGATLGLPRPSSLGDLRGSERELG